jgi:hypothetical protein
VFQQVKQLWRRLVKKRHAVPASRPGFPLGVGMRERYRAHPDVVTEPLGEGMILVHLGNGVTFRLNPTGRVIWEQARQARCPADIVQSMERDYEVSRSQLEVEVQGIMSQLVGHELLEPEASNP